jgi:hypothetical protein
MSKPVQPHRAAEVPVFSRWLRHQRGKKPEAEVLALALRIDAPTPTPGGCVGGLCEPRREARAPTRVAPGPAQNGQRRPGRKRDAARRAGKEADYRVGRTGDAAPATGRHVRSRFRPSPTIRHPPETTATPKRAPVAIGNGARGGHFRRHVCSLSAYIERWGLNPGGGHDGNGTAAETPTVALMIGPPAVPLGCRAWQSTAGRRSHPGLRRTKALDAVGGER